MTASDEGTEHTIGRAATDLDVPLSHRETPTRAGRGRSGAKSGEEQQFKLRE